MAENAKYHPLFEHLLFSGQGRLAMSFGEIETVIGKPLPPSARTREEWWSNSSNGHSQARAWMRASYRTARVDLENETVEFNLEGWPAGFSRPDMMHTDPENAGFAEPPQALEQSEATPAPPQTADGDHPLFGIWKGKVKLVPGYDYTKPAYGPDE